MLSKLLVAFLFCFVSASVFAQDADSLYVVTKESKVYLEYNVKRGETLFMLAKRFHCPPALLADANGFTYHNALKDSTAVLVPLGDYNYLRTKPEHFHSAQMRRLFHKATATETDVFSISRNMGLNRDDLQQWNKAYDNMIRVGDVFLVGWILYDESQAPGYKAPVAKVIFEDAPKRNSTIRQAVPEAPKPIPVAQEKPKSKIHVNDEDTKNGKKPATTAAPAKEVTMVIMDTSKYKTSDVELQYMKQTENETRTTVEKGPAVFFDMPGGHAGNVFLGFHSGLPRGTIIKVFNPGTGKAIFVKILGPLPETKQYYNSVMGIISDAKEALGVKESRLWCELSYVAQ